MNDFSVLLNGIFALLLVSFSLLLLCNFLIVIWTLTNQIFFLFEKIEHKISQIKITFYNFIKNQ
jgi:hypothetical protein